jgi:hypothetical protein
MDYVKIGKIVIVLALNEWWIKMAQIVQMWNEINIHIHTLLHPGWPDCAKFRYLIKISQSCIVKG